MEATCSNCNHWETETPAVQNRDNYGECEVLSPSESSMSYVLPVVESDHSPLKDVEFITTGEFGCNQFEPEQS